LNVDEPNPEIKVEEFINFLPVLAYAGSFMKQIDAAGILDMAMTGTTATLHFGGSRFSSGVGCTDCFSRVCSYCRMSRTVSPSPDELYVR